MPDFGRAARAAPLAGCVIGAIAGAALIALRLAHVPTLVAAIGAVATLVAVTGALHEDGLADVADGFGGGATREAKLAIMRDSRLGAYGAVALFLSLMLRVAAVMSIAEQGIFAAIVALASVGAVSRAAGLLPMRNLPSARSDGAGAAARISASALRTALVVAGAVSLAPLAAGASLVRVACMDVAALLAAALVSKLAQRQIGGYTGDVLGAAQQAAEIAALVVLSASG